MGKKEDLIKEAKRLELIQEAKALEAQQQAPEESSAAEQVAGGARSALEGATLGASEPVMSGIMAAEQHIKTAAQEAKSPQEFYDLVTNMDRLKGQYAADVERRRQFKQENPRTSMYSEMSGAAIPAIFSGGESTAAKALGASGELINEVGTGARQLVQKIPGMASQLESTGVGGSVARLAEHGVGGAAQGLAQEGTIRAIEEPTGFIQPQDQLPGLGETAALGGMVGAGFQAPGEMIDQAGRAGKFAAKVLTGVRPGDIDSYLERPEAIRNAKSVSQIKDEVDATIGKLRDDVENAKLNREQAHDALRQAESKVDDLVRENKYVVNQKKADIRQQFREARSDLDRTFKEQMSESKVAKVPIKVDDVLDSVENVKQQVSDLSSESYKILGQHEGSFKLGGVVKELDRLQNDLKVNGQLLSKDAEDAHGVLDKWKEKLSAMKGNLSGPQMKKIIQELDSDIRQYGDKQAGQFSDKTYNSLLGVRRGIDNQIKDQVAGYREIMEETAKMNEKRGLVAKLFGKRESITSKLSRIDSPNLEFEREALKDLGASTGKDFSSPLDEYMSLKNRGRTSIDQENLRQGLPEYGPYKEAMIQNARASRPEFGQSLIDKARTASPEAQAMRTAQGGMAEAEQGLAGAKGALQPFQGITEKNSENTIRTLMGDRTRKLQLQQIMSQLSDVSDQDFEQMINDIRVKESFDKGFQNGSSNVNLWSGLMGAMGFISGGPMLSIEMGGTGYAVGKVMDAYGPKITRRVLDGIIAIRGVPTIQKIGQMFADLPPDLVQKLKSDLIRMSSMGLNAGGIVIPPDQRHDVAADFEGADNLDSVQKATAITGLNKSGVVDSKDMHNLISGGQKTDIADIPREQAPKKLPPTYKQVTDFAKNKKPEAF